MKRSIILKKPTPVYSLTTVNSFLKKWDRFWFESDQPLSLALVRISLGISMLLTYFGRFFELSYYAKDSVISNTFIEQFVSPELYLPFFKVFNIGLSPLILQTVFMLLIIAFIIGALNRIGVFIFWFLHLSFLYRNSAIIFGADFVSATFLFYFIFANSQRRFSIFRSNENLSSEILSSVAVRLIQVQMCFIYAFTGFEKFKGGTWWDGTALWNVFSNPQFTAIDLSWFRQFPLFIVFIGIATLIFEVYFPVMVYWEKFKKLWLTLGVFFHLGITVFLGLYTFSFVMISIYWIFLTESEIKKLVSQLPILRKLSLDPRQLA